jgi:hypothetical protein
MRCRRPQNYPTPTRRSCPPPPLPCRRQFVCAILPGAMPRRRVTTRLTIDRTMQLHLPAATDRRACIGRRRVTDHSNDPLVDEWNEVFEAYAAAEGVEMVGGGSHRHITRLRLSWIRRVGKWQEATGLKTFREDWSYASEFSRADRGDDGNGLPRCLKTAHRAGSFY